MENINARRSYLWIRYDNSVGDVEGAVAFYVTEPSPGNSKAVPVEWRVYYGNEQQIYFSCFIDFFDKDMRGYDELARLLLLIGYWGMTDEEALYTLGNLDFGFIPWLVTEFIKEILGLYSEKGSYPRSNTYSGADGWDTSGWIASPLLVLTDEWYYRIWRNNKQSNYFDHIVLWVDPQAPDVDIEINRIIVRLNGRRILYWTIPQSHLHFNRNQPLDLSSDISLCRSLYIKRPDVYTQTCQLPIYIPYTSEVQLSPILERTADDYAQGWDYRYASEWCYDCEEDKYPPTPESWCTEYVCYLLRNGYASSSLEDCGGNHPHEVGVPYMSTYFEDKNRRISPDDGYSWGDELTGTVKSGYYAGLHYTDQSGGEKKGWHSTLFIDWVEGESPTDPYHGCWATFYATGGNQSNGRVSVNRVHFLNTLSRCSEDDWPTELEFYRCYWGLSDRGYCFFGKTD